LHSNPSKSLILLSNISSFVELHWTLAPISTPIIIFLFVSLRYHKFGLCFVLTIFSFGKKREKRMNYFIGKSSFSEMSIITGKSIWKMSYKVVLIHWPKEGLCRSTLYQNWKLLRNDLAKKIRLWSLLIIIIWSMKMDWGIISYMDNIIWRWKRLKKFKVSTTTLLIYQKINALIAHKNRKNCAEIASFSFYISLLMSNRENKREEFNHHNMKK
jgi:hypothetical protein